jgi:cytochrome P450
MDSALPPGPGLPSAVQTVGWWTRLIPFLERARSRFGRRFTVRLLGTPPFVLLTDPDEVKELFTAPPDVLHPGEGARVLEPVVGRNSVILLDEDAHLEQRKLMLPAFHGEKMERLSGAMAEVAEREIASWARDEPITLHSRFQALTLEIILRAVFGLEAGERLDALRDRLTAILEFGSRPQSLLPPAQKGLLGRIGGYEGFAELKYKTDALLFDLIEERRAEEGDGDDVLAMLLAARHEDGSPMSPQELRDELMTLLVAGHETTASQLAWALERLAREPGIVERIVAESERDEDAYLTATIQETMRSRPVIPNAAPRFVVKPVEIGGWSYPTDVCLVANAYLIHHDAEIYPDPYVFRPERFLEQAPGTYTWIPFGGGRRRCLGASFALLEMNIVLRALLTTTELRTTGEGVELTRRRAITISPRRGAKTILRDRDRQPVAA